MGPLLNPDPDLRCQTTPSIWALGSHQPVHLCYRNGSLSITSCSFLQVQTISSTLKRALCNSQLITLRRVTLHLQRLTETLAAPWET